MATSQCRTQVNESELRGLTYELPIGENSVRHHRWIYNTITKRRQYEKTPNRNSNHPLIKLKLQYRLNHGLTRATNIFPRS